MASFAYVAKDATSGKEVRDSVAAASAADAIEALFKRDLLVLSIEENVNKQSRAMGGIVALSDLVIFTRQLATMVRVIKKTQWPIGRTRKPIQLS